jgi:hypothetical protein
MMKNLKQFLAIALIAVFMSSCSSTSVINSWKDPNSTDDPDKWEKVLVAVQSTTDGQRRVAEDKLASLSGRLYPSYMLFPDKSSIQNESDLKRKISEGDFDAIMTFRLVNRDKQTSYVPGSYTGGYWGYHRGYWGGYYDPGYYREDTYYAVETQVFSLAEDKLVWSSITSTANPSKADKTIEEIARMTYRQMEKDGFIHPEK